MSEHGGDIRVCVGCGVPFVLDAGEMKFYTMRDLRLPRRCPDCRRARRLARDEADRGADTHRT